MGFSWDLLGCLLDLHRIFIKVHGILVGCSWIKWENSLVSCDLVGLHECFYGSIMVNLRFMKM